nr:ErpA-related iron-sulfur cluster insertion protein [Mailhella massiliensis]
MLGLGMDERDEDEDEKVVVEDVPFIADNDFLMKYGKAFELSFNEDRQVVLTALEASL